MELHGLLPLFLFSILGRSLAEYGTPFLAKVNGDTDPEGIVVNPGGNSIRIDENRPVPGGNNFIAIINYSGIDLKIGSVEGSGLKPNFTIVRHENKVYVQIENMLDYENRGPSSWKVYLIPEPPSILTVFVEDVNDQEPIFTTYADQPILVEEGSIPANPILFTYKAEDNDTVDEHLKYKLKDLQNGDDTPFEMDEESGELRLAKALDYQMQTTYRLQIMATDSGDLHVSNAPMVTIIDVIDRPNLEPKWISSTYRIQVTENNDPDTDPPLFTYRAVDADFGVNSPITYELLQVPTNSENVPYLRINPTTGELHANIVIDAEVGPESFEFVVVAKEVEEPRLNVTETVAFFITGLNDNTPTFENGESVMNFDIQIPENSFGSLPGLDGLIIMDKDRGLEDSEFVAKLKANDPDTEELVNEVFQVLPSSGYGGAKFSIIIKPNAVIDYEDPKWQNGVRFYVSVEETLDSERSAQGVITLIVQDLNDLSPQFQTQSPDGAIEIQVPENIPPLQPFVSAVSALDGDISPAFGTDSVRYKWSNSIPSDLFLDPITGEIWTLSENAFDRETLPVEIYVIEAADMEGGPNSRIATAVLRLIINDYNDAPPVITSEKRQTRILENIDPDQYGPIFEGIQISDPDETPNLSVSCEIIGPEGTENWFACESDQNIMTGTIEAKIVLGTVRPDYEVTNRVDINMTVVDRDPDGGILQETYELFSINIDNENDVQPIFEQPRPISVRETAECEEEECETDIEREIYQFRATDKDSTPDEFGFRIASEVPGTLDLVEILRQGILRRKYGAKIDREQREFLFLNVTVLNCDKDGENCDEDLSSTIEVEINVIDLNDEKPIFVDNEPPLRVAEGPDSVGYEIHKFEATDADDEDRFRTVNYFLDEEHENGHGIDKFEIDRVTGVLKVKKEIDFEVDPSFQLRILARDNAGSHSNSNEVPKIVTITTIDVNDNRPEFSNATFVPLPEDKIERDQLLGEVVVKDADGIGPNSEVEVELTDVTWNCQNCGSMQWPEYFRGEFDLPSRKFKIFAEKSLLNFFGEFLFKIHACDKGLPIKENEVTFSFQVVDINNHKPEIVFPAADTHVYISENHTFGTVMIEWDNVKVPHLQANDEDDPDPSVGNGVVSYSINPIGDGGRYFDAKLFGDKWHLVVKEQLKSHHEPIIVEIIAADGGTPQLKSNQTMLITVVPSENQAPLFKIRNAHVKFEENVGGESDNLHLAVDLDTVDGGWNIFNEVICYFIVDGDLSNSFQLNQDTNKLSLRKPLDREEIPNYNLLIFAKNNLPGNCQYPNIPPDPMSPGILNVTVEVIDQKDTTPQFVKQGSIISGGIRTTTGTIGSSTSIKLIAEDPDLNERLEFSINEASLVRHGSSLDAIESPVFSLSADNEILINFLANEAMRGYFTFSVEVKDSVGKTSSADCKVYITTEANDAEFKFDNDPSVFTDKMKKDAREILSDVYEYRCNIDNTRSSTDENGNAIPGKTTLETHFIDDDKNEPVPSILITNLPFDDPEKFINLTARLSGIGLNLDVRSYYEEGTDVKPNEIVTYLLIGGVVVLSAILIIISVTCWFNSKRLSLRVRALTASTFGSKESGLNRRDSFELPNTNQHAVQGSNPIWTTMDTGETEFDVQSVGSGGSVLIGLENDEDFRNYAEPTGGEDDFSFAFGPSQSHGTSNPIFAENWGEDAGEEITSEPLPPVVGRRNPLSLGQFDE